MVNDMREKIKDALRSDTELISFLGGVTATQKRIYCASAPNAEEFPRIIILELFSHDDVSADNESGYEDGRYRVTLYTKDKDYSFIIKKIKKILKQTFSFSVIEKGSDDYESDTKVYSKPIEIEMLEESEEI